MHRTMAAIFAVSIESITELPLVITCTAASRYGRHEGEIQRLSAELAAKKKECEALLATKNSLQSKLTSMREQNRTMDATIEHFRKQLDEAKQVIDQKDAEILQYNNMARIINELTGKVQPANLSSSKNI
ncbi:hypothetical protein ACTXT7_000416 [Hymenolepis weldensis]